MSDYTKYLQASKKLKSYVLIRDRGCVYCQQNYMMHPKYPDVLDCTILDPMHYIAKSHQGLGIPENIVSGCRYHHHLQENGNKGLGPEMTRMMKEYLKSIYPEWNKKILIYTKDRKEEIEKAWKQWK